MKRKLKIIGIILGSFLLLIFLGFSIWTAFPAGPGETATAALETTDTLVSVAQMPGWIIFAPQENEPQVGLVFYPGGNVDFRSYSPLLWKIAQAGYLVVVPEMPFNMAVFAPAKAAQIMEAYPQITTWAVGGHSLGGAMAANFASNNLDRVSGLVFWAAYPTSSDDLSRSNLAVTSIYASNDGLATDEDIKASRALLPPATTWVKIEGGNHAQFGDYGAQRGDNAATILASQQWGQVVEATVALLKQITP